MPKNDVSSWDTTPANNTDVGGVDLAENSMRPRDVNNAIRTMMAQIATGIGNGEFGPLDSEIREKLTGNRTYYVGSTIPAPSITIATPAVVSSTAHGLSVNSPVVFNVPQNTTTATISAANPAVVTMTNTFAAGRPVTFRSTGSLPIPLVQGTTYYVISTGLSGSSFQVSATVGGAAINTTAPTATFTNGSANIGITNANTYLAVGNIVRFATTGGLPTNFAAGTDYYVLTASATLITVSATNGGSAIVAGSAGTGTQTVLQAGTQFVSTAGALPTGITEGTTYYVISAGLTANAFQISTSQGGAAVNTSGSVTGSPIYGAYTGNDSNNGLASTPGGAFLTIGKAATVAAALDAATFNVTVSVAAGTFSENVVLPAMLGSGTFTLTGAGTGSTTIQSVRLATRSEWAITSFKLTGGTNLLEFGAYAKCNQSGAIEFGTGTEHIYGRANSYWLCTANYTISGSATRHWRFDEGGTIFTFGRTVTLSGTPSFSGNFAYILYGTNGIVGSMTFTGSATGSRFYVANNAIMATGGGGINYLVGNSAGTTDTASGGIYT